MPFTQPTATIWMPQMPHRDRVIKGKMANGTDSTEVSFIGLINKYSNCF